jgi:hypothetical protein
MTRGSIVKINLFPLHFDQIDSMRVKTASVPTLPDRDADLLLFSTCISEAGLC